MNESVRDVTVIDEYLNARTCLDLPPPVTCCHLIIHPVIQVLILIVFFRHISHPTLKHRVSNQLSHTFNWVPSPELHFINNGVTIFILTVSSDLEDFACPLWTLGEAVNFLEKHMLVLQGWVGARLNLD